MFPPRSSDPGARHGPACLCVADKDRGAEQRLVGPAASARARSIAAQVRSDTSSTSATSPAVQRRGWRKMAVNRPHHVHRSPPERDGNHCAQAHSGDVAPVELRQLGRTALELRIETQIESMPRAFTRGRIFAELCDEGFPSGSGAALLQRQAGLGSVERLDLALFVDGKHNGVRVCGALRSLTRARSRSRSAGVTEMEIPVRMSQTRTPPVRRESLPRFKCQTRSTRERPMRMVIRGVVALLILVARLWSWALAGPPGRGLALS